MQISSREHEHGHYHQNVVSYEASSASTVPQLYSSNSTYGLKTLLSPSSSYHQKGSSSPQELHSSQPLLFLIFSLHSPITYLLLFKDLTSTVTSASVSSNLTTDILANFGNTSLYKTHPSTQVRFRFRRQK